MSRNALHYLLSMNTTSIDALVARRGEGRDAGSKHGDLSSAEQEVAIQQCIDGMARGVGSLDCAYWSGYAETAWQIARAVVMAPHSGVYGIIPRVETSSEQKVFRFISSYQGMSDFELPYGKRDQHGSRLSFRWGRCPWHWGGQPAGNRYWNYENQETFEREFNDQHGLITRGCEPVDAETLDLFRVNICAHVQTGYFDHQSNQWKRCDPSSAEPSRASWEAVQKAEHAAR